MRDLCREANMAMLVVLASLTTRAWGSSQAASAGLECCTTRPEDALLVNGPFDLSISGGDFFRVFFESTNLTDTLSPGSECPGDLLSQVYNCSLGIWDHDPVVSFSGAESAPDFQEEFSRVFFEFTNLAEIRAVPAGGSDSLLSQVCSSHFDVYEHLSFVSIYTSHSAGNSEMVERGDLFLSLCAWYVNATSRRVTGSVSLEQFKCQIFLVAFSAIWRCMLHYSVRVPCGISKVLCGILVSTVVHILSTSELIIRAAVSQLVVAGGFPHKLLLGALLFLPMGSATCPHCFDQLEGCAGGDKCPFLATTAKNAAAIVAGTGTSVLVLTHLLPRDYLTVMTRTILDVFLATVRRPIPGATPDIRGWDVNKLMEAFRDRTVPRGEIISELSSLIPGATEEQRDTIKLCLETMKMFASVDSTTGAARSGDTSGVRQVLWALAGRIVARGSGVLTLTVEKGENNETPASSKISEKMNRPSSAIEYCERITIFIQLAHSLGTCNVLACTKFFRVVAYDTMLRDKLSWQISHELVLVYFEDMDNSLTLNFGNVVESGGQDSRLARAKVRAEENFKGDGGKGIFRDDEGNKQLIKFNGNDSKNSTQCCASWNLGNDHPQKALFANGKCRYKHACDRYISDDGKQCGSVDHKRAGCTHPDAKPISFKPTK